MKSLIACVATLAAIAGVTFVTSSIPPAASQVQPVVFQAPQPLDQPADMPTVGELSNVLTSLVDPGVPFQNKAYLVEGGVNPTEAALADHSLQKAARKGELPLSFGIANIQPAGPGAATADVTVSGPKLPPRTLNVTFVNQGSWMLAHGSALSLLQEAAAA